MSSMQVRENLYWVGVQDYDLRVFDVIMHTNYGTSYNAYILQTSEGAILFETAKAQFFDEFLVNILEVCELNDIKYIILNHTEPDHTGSLEKLLKMIPDVKIIASEIGITFLSEICNTKIHGIAVGDDDAITLGGYTMRFFSVPFLHWPDSIYTYVEENGILFSCDSFGCHYADNLVCNDLIKGDFIDAYQYYFNMIMGPFKSYVRAALKKIKELNLTTICPGHGPVLRENINSYLDLYAEWSYERKAVERDKPKVTIAFVSAYGYTEELSGKIQEGIERTINADVYKFDMVGSRHDEVLNELISSDGIILGTPTVNGDALSPIHNLVNEMNGVMHGGKVAGAFGSYGWSGEGPDMIMARLEILRMNTLSPAYKTVFKPSEKELEGAVDYGRRFAEKLKNEWTSAGKPQKGMNLWKCSICGEILKSSLAPSFCTVCGAGPEAFVEYIEEIINFKSDEDMKVLIVGSGPGAVYAADAVRKRNTHAEITLFSKDSELPYYRPALTKQLADNLKIDDILIFPENYYDDNNITIMRETEIVDLMPAEKMVKDAKGRCYEYDKLVLALGGRCFVPPIKGTELPEVFTLRTFSDFENIKSTIGKSKKIVVLGGGLLGLEVAYSIKQLGKDVHVLEMAPRILPKQLDLTGSELLMQKINDSKISVELGVLAKEISGDIKVRGILTDKNEFIEADAVIISAGIRSNITLAAKAGIEVNDGIVVNQKMQTSDENIFAVGDCAMFDGVVSGLWEPAIQQGSIAGANIAGDEKVYSQMILGASMHAFDTAIFSVGDIGFFDHLDYVHVNSRNDIHGTYKNLVFKNNKLTGTLLVGDLSLMNSLLASVKKQLTPQQAMDDKLFS